jgi:hypothetical protein
LRHHPYDVLYLTRIFRVHDVFDTDTDISKAKK